MLLMGIKKVLMLGKRTGAQSKSRSDALMVLGMDNRKAAETEIVKGKRME